VATESGGAGEAVGVVRMVGPKEVLLSIRVVWRGDFLLVLPLVQRLVALETRGA